MTIKILGSGCPNCQKLEANATQAIKDLGLNDIQIEHVYDVNKIVECGVMSTPAVMIDDKVMASGRIPEVNEIKSWLKK